MRKFHFLLWLGLILTLVACTGSDDDAAAELQKIRLPMGYIPDPQYAPFYVAVEKGYFAAAGIELEFDYSFETDGLALVGARRLRAVMVPTLPHRRDQPGLCQHHRARRFTRPRRWSSRLLWGQLRGVRRSPRRQWPHPR